VWTYDKSSIKLLAFLISLDHALTDRQQVVIEVVITTTFLACSQQVNSRIPSCLYVHDSSKRSRITERNYRSGRSPIQKTLSKTQALAASCAATSPRMRPIKQPGSLLLLHKPGN
jgi:hypothetical protein